MIQISNNLPLHIFNPRDISEIENRRVGSKNGQTRALQQLLSIRLQIVTHKGKATGASGWSSSSGE